MNKITTILLAALLLLTLAACASGTSPESDSSTAETSSEGAAAQQSEGQQETKPEESSERIVSTTVAITELMDALEVELVGIPTSVKNLPERYEGLTEIGNPMNPDMELVRMLKPTEVLSVTTLAYDLTPKFERAGIKAEFLDFTSLEKMNETIEALGQKYGREQQAAEIIEKHRLKQEQIETAIAGKSSPSVLILMGIPGSYLVATENSYIGDLVKRAGGVNVVQGETVEYVASNTEHLQQANPDIILRAAHGLPDEVVKMFDKEFQRNDIWKHFEAVKQGNVYDLEETLFGTTGNLAVNEALDELIGMLYK
ncbi:heme ABC transporter substrate-binding protein IsdE [Paenibacillaceae bacterium]|nr:heme ABC transporter substrate-binding protein IsdE [Paenibacillaceae bacterium]